MKAALSAALAAVVFSAAAFAGAIEVARFEDAGREARYLDLIGQMRCLVCQNQTLAESDAPLAKDMRAVIRQMLQDGATDAEVIDFIVARYGDFALYRPPLVARTVLLWFAPFLFVVVALLLTPLFVARHRVALSERERATAQQLLRE